MSRLAVVGAGAWGSALANLWRNAGLEVRIWSRRAPDTTAFKNADAIVIAVSAQDMGKVLRGLELPPGIPVIITAKGIEHDSHRFVHEVAADVAPGHPALILSGPSFADDVSRGLPTAVTLAGPTLSLAQHWSKQLAVPHFRIYPTDDVIGVAVGGSLKNVLAIACGISEGKALGASARAALVARGFSEMMRLGRALGARPETMMGLSGLGDLMLTCTSPQSRNYGFGIRLGQGATVAEAVAQSRGVVEGVATARAALDLARQHNLAMPITESVYAIVELGAKPEDMIQALLARPVAAEFL